MILAKTAINEAKKKMFGLQIMILDVFSINKIALKLYQKLGFREYERLKRGIIYKGKYIDKIKMVLRF